MLRLWGIRHLRYWWNRRRLYAWAEACAQFGLGLGRPNPSDLKHLDAIWRGEA